MVYLLLPGTKGPSGQATGSPGRALDRFTTSASYQLLPPPYLWRTPAIWTPQAQPDEPARPVEEPCRQADDALHTGPVCCDRHGGCGFVLFPRSSTLVTMVVPGKGGFMSERSLGWDRILGYGGVVLVVIAFVTLFADLGVDAEVVTSVVGLAMVAWMTILTVRHIQVYPAGAGRELLIASWVILGALIAFAVFQAIDTAAFDEGVLDGLLSLAAAPPRVVLMLPLLLASLAILKDGHAPTSRRQQLAAPS